MTNETIVTIESLSHDGRGIAHIQGKTVFVQGGLPGETLRFQYTKRHRQYDEAKTLQVIQPSNERAIPDCGHFGVCGGCSLQHYQALAQIAHKQQVLLEQLQHIGNVKPEIILPPLTAQALGYRRKARLGVKYVKQKNKVLIGFREQNSRYLADLSTCSVLHPSVGSKLNQLSLVIAQLSVFDAIPQIEVAVADAVTALVIRHLKPLTDEDLSTLRGFAQQHSFYIYLQPGNVETCHLFWPENSDPFLSYQLLDDQLTLRFHPLDFTQINAGINQQMVACAIKLLQPQKHEKLLDLFCGLGNFTLPFSYSCQHIIGVEGGQEMVQRAQANAQYNHINNAKFYCADLNNNNFSSQPWAKEKFDKIILDPPRSGALTIVQAIRGFAAQQILYISCNPATLARDAKELTQQGYHLQQAGIMDMFPHTSHVEAIALFVQR